MVQIVAYTRGIGGALGSSSSLPFYRRIRFLFELLTDRHVFSTFRIHECDPEHSLTPSMLLGPEAFILQNWVPADDDEVEAFHLAHAQLASSGKVCGWIYDLEDPDLLDDARVQAILPFFRLILVPNAQLKVRARIFTHTPLQRVVALPSMLHFGWLHDFAPYQSLPPRVPHRPFLVSCLGPHDWQTFLPPFLEELDQQLLARDQTNEVALLGGKQICELCEHTHTPCLQVEEPLSALLYPRYLKHCSAVLCPQEGIREYDTIWAREASTLGIPVIAALHSTYELDALAGVYVFQSLTDPAAWVQTLLSWFFDPSQLSSYVAKSQTAAQIAFTTRVQSQLSFPSSVLARMLPGLTSLY